MGNRIKILASTAFSQRVFNSVQEVMQEYSIGYRRLKRLLDTGETLNDGKTTFEEFLDPGDYGGIDEFDEILLSPDSPAETGRDRHLAEEQNGI